MVMQKDESNPGSGGESTPRQSATPNSSGIPGSEQPMLLYCGCETCTRALAYRQSTAPERSRERWGVKSDPLNGGEVMCERCGRLLHWLTQPHPCPVAPPHPAACPCAACKGALPEDGAIVKCKTCGLYRCCCDAAAKHAANLETLNALENLRPLDLAAAVSGNSTHDETFGPKGRLDLFVNDERRSFKLVMATESGEVLSESFFGSAAALAISRSLQGTLAGWADPSELDAELLRLALERLKGAAIAHARSLALMRNRLDIPDSLESTAHELAVAVVSYAKAAEKCP